jgi:hypothetical protein
MKLSDIREPKFEVEISDTDRRSYDPYEVNTRLFEFDEKGVEAKYNRVRFAFGLPDLTRHQAMVLQAELINFIESIPLARKKMSHAAELMRFYSIQPSELEKLDLFDRIGLVQNMVKIEARERLAYQDDIAIVLSGKEGAENKTRLVEIAYVDDPESQMDLIEGLTRK